MTGRESDTKVISTKEREDVDDVDYGDGWAQFQNLFRLQVKRLGGKWAWR